MSNDYLIQTTDLHALKITRSDAATHPLIYISTNHRTFGMSEAMCEELVKGLLALLRGGFTRALSEMALELELQDQAFRASRMQAPTTEPLRSSSASKPELDQL